MQYTSVTIVNSYFFSISINENILCKLSTTASDDLVQLLNCYLPPIRNITSIRLVTGPGSLTSTRSLLSFVHGLNIFNQIQVQYVDSLRDILLEQKEGRVSIFALTNKKFIVAQMVFNKSENNYLSKYHESISEKLFYKYDFFNHESLKILLKSIPSNISIIFDQNMESLKDLFPSDRKFSISYWSSIDVSNSSIFSRHENSIVNYSFL